MQEAQRISEQDRAMMSIMPYRQAIDERYGLTMPESVKKIYADLQAMKQRVMIRLVEELDDYNFPNTHTHYIMMIRCMSNDADLRIILNAARHLMLISEYNIERVYVGELSNEYEKSTIYVSYTCANETILLDELSKHRVDVIIPYEKLKRIWLDLFFAAGYLAKWGGVLNIKRQQV